VWHRELTRVPVQTEENVSGQMHEDAQFVPMLICDMEIHVFASPTSVRSLDGGAAPQVQ
jgi:hypothetical protein